MESIDSETAAWFCVRTHLKHEHIAAAQLRQALEIKVFLPRIRYQRSTRSGRFWVIEALFQNYLFAHFELAAALRRVQNARGVRGVVHFGTRWPSIPEQVIEHLRGLLDGQELRTIENDLQPGDPVEIGSGAMCGLRAVVTRVMPAKQRVAVLLDFLGRQITVELNRSQLISSVGDEHRKACFSVWDASTAEPIEPRYEYSW